MAGLALQEPLVTAAAPNAATRSQHMLGARWHAPRWWTRPGSPWHCRASRPLPSWLRRASSSRRKPSRRPSHRPRRKEYLRDGAARPSSSGCDRCYKVALRAAHRNTQQTLPQPPPLPKDSGEAAGSSKKLFPWKKLTHCGDHRFLSALVHRLAGGQAQPPSPGDEPVLRGARRDCRRAGGPGVRPGAAGLLPARPAGAGARGAREAAAARARPH